MEKMPKTAKLVLHVSVAMAINLDKGCINIKRHVLMKYL